MEAFAEEMLEIQTRVLSHSDHPANGPFRCLVFTKEEFEAAVELAAQRKVQGRSSEGSSSSMPAEAGPSNAAAPLSLCTAMVLFDASTAEAGPPPPDFSDGPTVEDVSMD